MTKQEFRHVYFVFFNTLKWGILEEMMSYG